MHADSHQLDGTTSSEEENAAEGLAAHLDALKNCEGASCRAAEEAETVP